MHFIRRPFCPGGDELKIKVKMAQSQNASKHINKWSVCILFGMYNTQDRERSQKFRNEIFHKCLIFQQPGASITPLQWCKESLKAYQITSNSTVYSKACFSEPQRKHQNCVTGLPKGNPLVSRDFPQGPGIKSFVAFFVVGLNKLWKKCHVAEIWDMMLMWCHCDLGTNQCVFTSKGEITCH